MPRQPRAQEDKPSRVRSRGAEQAAFADAQVYFTCKADQCRITPKTTRVQDAHPDEAERADIFAAAQGRCFLCGSVVPGATDGRFVTIIR